MKTQFIIWFYLKYSLYFVCFADSFESTTEIVLAPHGTLLWERFRRKEEEGSSTQKPERRISDLQDLTIWDKINRISI